MLRNSEQIEEKNKRIEPQLPKLPKPFQQRIIQTNFECTEIKNHLNFPITKNIEIKSSDHALDRSTNTNKQSLSVVRLHQHYIHKTIIHHNQTNPTQNSNPLQQRDHEPQLHLSRSTNKTKHKKFQIHAINPASTKIIHCNKKTIHKQEITRIQAKKEKTQNLQNRLQQPDQELRSPNNKPQQTSNACKKKKLNQSSRKNQQYTKKNHSLQQQT